MSRLMFVAAVLTFVVWMAQTVAQTPASGPVLKPTAATSGVGISNAALIDRGEIRVLRVDVAPGGVRNIHSHDDVVYHLFIPITGKVQFQAGSEKPVEVAPWQTQFLKGGTKHGFTNPGTSTVTVMEVFVKK